MVAHHTKAFVACAAFGLALPGAPGCELGRRHVEVAHPVDDRSEVIETTVGVDGGLGSADGDVHTESDASIAVLAEEAPEPPRIAIPHFDEEPTTRISIHREKRSVVVSGKGLKINGAPQDRAVEIGWSESGLTLRGKALPDGTRVTAEVDIRVRKIGSFPGSVIFFHNETHMLVVNEVPLERYVQTVVQSEVPEVLKAQAVAARTYALAKMAVHSGQYSLESTVMDQVYRPRRLDKGIVEAVRVTRGEVLVFESSLIETKYHSTCGGRTENPDEVWPELGMHHQWSVTCGTCTKSPHYRWSLSLTFDELQRGLGEVRSGLKRVTGIQVTKRSRAHRVLAVEVRTERGSFELTGRSFRRAVSLRKVRSTSFDVRPRPGGFTLEGRGFGHGVGMCQWGASGMA